MSSQHEICDVPKFVELNELSSSRSGGQIVFATDDWFAAAECLLEDAAPIFKPDVYTEFGKWMDGWETRRKRCAGHDWCIVKLGVPGVLRGVDVDTSFFTGNFAPRYSIQAANLSEEDEALIPSRSIHAIGTACTEDQHEKIHKLQSHHWTELIPMTELQPGYANTCHNYKNITSNRTWTHLRLNIYPDGGIARLRVFGEARPLKSIDKYETIDLVSMKNGGVCVDFSNAHFGHPRNLIRPDKAESMADGWETARRLDRPPIIELDDMGTLEVTGNEWAVFRLGHVGIVSSLIVDTKHFKGNYPDSVQIDGILTKDTQKLSMTHKDWKCILPKSKLSPDHMHEYLKDDFKFKGPFSHIRITMAPDGGISRVKVFGTIHTSRFM